MKENRDEMAGRSAEDLRHERLCALVLGELEAEQAQALEAELAVDADLRAEKERIEATLGLVSSNLSGGEALPDEMLRALEQEARPLPRLEPASRRWYGRPAVQLAAGIAALATGVLGGKALFGPLAPESARLAATGDELARLDSKELTKAMEVPAPAASAEPVLRDAGVVSDSKGQPQGKYGGRYGADRSAGPSASGKIYRGPGDSAPSRERLRSLGYGGGSGVPEATRGVASVGKIAAGAAEPPPPGGGGGGYGGPMTNGPGPSAPGPAGPPATASGPSTPGPVSPGPGSPGPHSPGPPSAGPSRPDGRVDLGQVEEETEVVELDDQRQPEPVDLDALCLEETQRILHDCMPLPDERPQDMFFRFWGDNPFVLTRLDAQSTFAVDVDTASYALARRYLVDGHLPEKAQIRTEEFVNYFRPDLEAPREGTFAIHTELAPSRFGSGEDAPGERWMLRVGLRGKEVVREERAPVALTFVVDTSGSMRRDNRMGLVKHALRLLVAQLDSQDSIAIVAFSKTANLVLPMTSAQSRGIIEAAIHGLQPGGGTNAEGGLMLGYEVAVDGLTEGASNRVVLLSDGVANLGETDQDRINEAVRRQREAGIYLNTIGVGLGNHDDAFLEQLANKGDGLCNYVDSETEARRALVDNFIGAFEPIARDVKIQVEFDPGQVQAYRLLGYENRAIADADFRNDAVDAGEVGAGHQVVALFELDLTGSRGNEPLAEVRVRWKAPTGPGRDPLEDAATEASRPVEFESATTFEAASRGYRRSAIVAQFAEILRRSVHAREDSLDELIAEARSLQTPLGSAEEDRDYDEFVQLLERSRELILESLPEDDDLSRCIDAVRRNRILRAQLEELQRAENDSLLAELELENERLEARIRELLRKELEERYR